MAELSADNIFRFFRNVLFSTWFLAALPAVLASLFLPHVTSRYTVMLEDLGQDLSFPKYCDLDSDSISELISTDKGIPYYYVLVQANNFDVFDQWNLKDSLNPMISEVNFGDYDNDRYQEIYIFSYSNDSLFLNVNEIMDPDGLLLERKFISKVSVIKKELTSSVAFAGLFDVNRDGYSELYFIIHTGFGVEPRRLLYYDISNHTLHISDFTGIICLNPRFEDSDGDSKPEIFGLTVASGNHHKNIPYHDSSTWLMVFNERLQFEFSPVEFPGFTNRLETSSYSNDSIRGYLLSHNTTSVDTSTMKPCIMLYSVDGRLVKRKFLKDLDNNRAPKVTVRRIGDSDRIYILGNKFQELNSDLQPVETYESPFNSGFHVYQEDILDGSDKEMLLYSSKEGNLVIYGSGFSKIAELELKAGSSQWVISHNYTIEGKHKLLISIEKNSYSLSAEENRTYYLGYLAYPGIYFLLFMFILTIKKISLYQFQQKEQMKRRLLSLQLKSVKSQLDPHFTFNALNSVASLMYLDDRKAAYDYLSKFTNLIRRLLSDAERIYRSLNQELEFVRLYLDLEKLRFGGRLNYRIECDQSLSGNEMVPKLVLQTFAENAVKHGITARPEGGTLTISVKKDNNFILLIVQDDGIGRLRSEGLSHSTGKGLKLTGEFYDILNKITNRQIRHSITDLTDSEGNASGTKVEVWVPLIEKNMEDSFT
jgi:hypothetical protein